MLLFLSSWTNFFFTVHEFLWLPVVYRDNWIFRERWIEFTIWILVVAIIFIILLRCCICIPFFRPWYHKFCMTVGTLYTFDISCSFLTHIYIYITLLLYKETIISDHFIFLKFLLFFKCSMYHGTVMKSDCHTIVISIQHFFYMQL